MARNYRQGHYELMNPKKYSGNKKPIYRSALELQVFRFLDSHPSIVRWASEPIQIPYYNQLKKVQTVYVPDLFVVYADSKGKEHAELIEIKPKSQSSMADAKSTADKYAVALNMMKWEAAAAWCRNKNMRFRIMTEEDIYLNAKGTKKKKK